MTHLHIVHGISIQIENSEGKEKPVPLQLKPLTMKAVNAKLKKFHGYSWKIKYWK